MQMIQQNIETIDVVDKHMKEKILFNINETVSVKITLSKGYNDS